MISSKQDPDNINPPVPPSNSSLECTKLNNNIIYEELTNILNQEDSKSLDNTSLVKHFENNKILDNPELIQYMCSNNGIFNNIYRGHFIIKNKTFTYMDNINSMCQCWLMYLYH
jgi:hypothetical protein